MNKTIQNGKEIILDKHDECVLYATNEVKNFRSFER
jgi:hypothetical protein